MGIIYKAAYDINAMRFDTISFFVFKNARRKTFRLITLSILSNSIGSDLVQILNNKLPWPFQTNQVLVYH